MKIQRIFGAVLLSIGTLVLGFSPSAYATPTLSFQVDGGPITTCADNAACDANGALGIVTYTLPLSGGFTVNVTVGITKPVFGGSHMDLNSVVVQTTGGTHDLKMGFSETGFSLVGGLTGTVGGALMFGAGSTVSAQGFYDTTNTLFGAGGALSFTIGPFGPGAFAGTVTGPGPSAQPYSLTQFVNVHTVGAGTLSYDFDMHVVPEPANAMLMGVGVIILATVSAIRRKRHV